MRSKRRSACRCNDTEGVRSSDAGFDVVRTNLGELGRLGVLLCLQRAVGACRAVSVSQWL